MKPISDKVYGHDDIIKCGRMKSKTVREIIETNRPKIFVLVKKGYLFTDEVLADAHITKTERDHKVFNEVVHHETDKKTYAKETASLKSILRSLNMDYIDEVTANETTEEVEPLDFSEQCDE